MQHVFCMLPIILREERRRRIAQGKNGVVSGYPTRLLPQFAVEVCHQTPIVFQESLVGYSDLLFGYA